MTKQIGEYQVTTGTAIMVTLGETERIPVRLVRWLPNMSRDGDMMYFGVESLESMDEDEIGDTLCCEWENTSMDWKDLDTFEADE